MSHSKDKKTESKNFVDILNGDVVNSGFTTGVLSTALEGLSSARHDDRDAVGRVLATESFTGSDLAKVRTATATIESDIEASLKAANISVESYQKRAAAAAALYGRDTVSFLRAELRAPSKDSTVIGGQVSKESFMRKGVSISTESYSEKDLRNYRRFSAIYNLQSVKQDAVSDAFFPLIIMDSLEIGVSAAITVTMVFSDTLRSMAGSVAQFRRVNIVKGFRDSKVLENNIVKVVPVYRDSGAGTSNVHFADPTLITPAEKSLGLGTKVLTAPIAKGTKIDLLGISQRKEMLAAGFSNFTDTLSFAGRLENVYVKLGEEAFRLDVYSVPGSIYTPTYIGDDRQLNLIMHTTSVQLSAGTLTANGEESAEQFIKDYNLRLGVRVSSTILTDRGTMDIEGGALELVGATDAEGKPVTAAVEKQLREFVAKGEVIAFDIEQWFENENLRHQGQLFEEKTYLLTLPVPYQSPMTIYKSTFDSENMEEHVGTLVAATSMRMSVSAVRELERASATLKNFKNILDEEGSAPDLDVIGAYIIKPTWLGGEFSVLDMVDSTASANRPDDLEAAIKELLHTFAIELVEKSEYIQAGRLITGNQDFKPELVVAVSQRMSGYLPTEFERGGYKFTVVSSLLEEFDDQIYMAFRNSTSNDGGKNLDPMNFGNTIWAPELLSNMPRDLNGQTSQMLTMMPRWKHNWNNPAIVDIKLTGLDTIYKKIPIETRPFK